MTQCRDDRDLERSAILLVSRGVPAEREPLVRWAAGLGSDPIAETVRHAASCPRCMDDLVLLMGLELTLRSQDAEVARPSVVPLRRLDRSVWKPAPAVFPQSEPAPEAVYQLAADSVPSSSDVTRIDAIVRDLTLASQDGAYLVRIRPARPGPGADAVLIGPSAEESADALSRTQEAQRVVLHCEGTDYPFDADGVAHLPAIPTGSAYLLVSTDRRS